MSNMNAWVKLLDWYHEMGVDEVIPPTPHAISSPLPLKPLLRVVPTPQKHNDSLEQLREDIENFQDCPLKHTAMSTVMSDGNPAAEIMLVGEAPGSEEDKQGKPFVGASGQLLDRILKSVGLDRNSVYISNVVFWRPPGNRTPTPQEIAMCMPFVQRHIRLIQPKYLVLLGGTATKALLNRAEGIIKLRGQWQKLHIGNESFDVMPTFHPSFLLRSPEYKKLVWQDFLSMVLKTKKDQ